MSSIESTRKSVEGFGGSLKMGELKEWPDFYSLHVGVTDQERMVILLGIQSTLT